MLACESDTSVEIRTDGELERWMERYQSAEPEAARVLVRALSPALLGFFRAQTATRQESEDLLQETWLRIHRVRHTYRPGEPLAPWVYAIARRVRVDAYRRRRRLEARESLTARLPEAAAPAPSAAALLPEFEELVAELPEAQREVVTMLKVCGLSLEEVARATASSVGAVKQKAHRAYERLRKSLDRDAGGPPR
jgi:RNA polymerase sigma-70 factor (ECF subfamily)